MSVYEGIIQGLNEALEYEKGNQQAKTTKLSVAPLPELKSFEIKNIRKSLNLTQVMFAAVVGVSPKTVEAWENGTNTPSGVARRMLSLLRTDPSILQRYNLMSK